MSFPHDAIANRLRTDLAQRGLRGPKPSWSLSAADTGWIFVLNLWSVWLTNRQLLWPHIPLLCGCMATAAALFASFDARQPRYPEMEALLNLPIEDGDVLRWHTSKMRRKWKLGCLIAFFFLWTVSPIDSPWSLLGLGAACALLGLAGVATMLIAALLPTRVSSLVALGFMGLFFYVWMLGVDGANILEGVDVVANLLPAAWPVQIWQWTVIDGNLNVAWLLAPTLLVAAAVPLLRDRLARAWHIVALAPAGRVVQAATAGVRRIGPVTLSDAAAWSTLDWRRGFLRWVSLALTKRERNLCRLFAPDLSALPRTIASGLAIALVGAALDRVRAPRFCRRLDDRGRRCPYGDTRHRLHVAPAVRIECAVPSEPVRVLSCWLS